jgi:hypothetical protein
MKHASTPLHEARKRAAKELKLPVSDWRVQRLAVLVSAFDQVQAQMAAGKVVNIDDMLKIDAALAEVRASVPVQHVVSVELVEGPIEHCPACGWHRDQQPPPEPPKSSESTPTKPAIAQALQASNVVTMRLRSIHDWPGAPVPET